MPTKEGHYGKNRGAKIDQADITSITPKAVDPDDKWFYGSDPAHPERRGSKGYDYARGPKKDKDR
jgi:hypothetical protein